MNEWSQSTLPLNTTGPFAGLKLIKESIKKDTNFENGITICLRFRISEIMSCEDSAIFFANLAQLIKVEKILKGSLDWMPSPSVKIQPLCGKVCLRCKVKTLLDVKKFVDITQQCFALLPQVNFPAINLNFH